jgi:hypothetical protein
LGQKAGDKGGGRMQMSVNAKMIVIAMTAEVILLFHFATIFVDAPALSCGDSGAACLSTLRLCKPDIPLSVLVYLHLSIRTDSLCLLARWNTVLPD